MSKRVGVYHNHGWLTDVTFRRGWQAYVFHWLLNRSESEHNGSRYLT